ncbi:dentin sialophosphoprotein-like [Ctenocephalides felis]|uniref:dentin sialophosphoprotein-like n=1 Tax=Ctenocephalides felis TaxID=7515 RepID=UPI000E6E2C94|nr:dentin sialophosphoprotein-like [Ctenocephalides felis]
MNSIRERSSCEASCVDSADTYNLTEIEDEDTCEYLQRRQSDVLLYNNDVDVDDEVYSRRYANKCDEYSGRPSGTKATSSGKSTPRHKPMELVVSHSSQTLVLKSSSRVMSDEHDTYSPEEDLSFLRHEHSADMTPDEFMMEDVMYLTDDQNKKYDQSLHSVISKSSTKEEKQRQNEEIVNLESSSISSETGSWESVFPMRSNQEAREMCATFLMNEKDFCSRDGKIKVNTGYRSYPVSRHSTPVKHNACFIDAASLVDDVDVWHTNYEAGTSTIKPTSLNFNHSNPINIFKPDKFQNELSVSESFETKTIKKNKHKDSSTSESNSYSERNGVTEFFEQQDLDFHTRFEMCRLTVDKISSDTPSSSPLNDLQQNNDDMTAKCLDIENLEADSTQSTTSDTNNELESTKANTTFTLNDSSNTDASDEAPVVIDKNFLTDNIVLPDTPHNSIIEVDCKDSPYKTQKYSEASPIISGGASVKDFVPKIRASPLIRKKFDATPILSGASAAYEVQEKFEEKQRRKLSTSCAWIVDVSDCSSTSSLDSRLNRETSRRDSTSSHKSSLGFFVDFNDKKSNSDNSSDESKGRSSSEEKRSLGYFIDLSREEPAKPKTPPSADKSMFSMFIDFGEKCVKSIPDRLAMSLHQRARSKSIAVEVNGTTKSKQGMARSLGRDNTNSCRDGMSTGEANGNKNGTTTFLSLRNLDDKKVTSFLDSSAQDGKADGLIQIRRRDKINLKQLKAPEFVKEPLEINQQNGEANINKTLNEVNVTVVEKQKPVDQDNVPIVKQLEDTLPNMDINESTKRHSWNLPEAPKPPQRFHKRAQSVSENSLPQTLIKSKVGSTYSIESNLSDFSGRSGLSSGSSSGYARMSDVNKKHKKDCKINETFDKSSPGSQTEGVLTDTDEDLTYQNEQNPDTVDGKVVDDTKVVEAAVVTESKPAPKIGYTLNLDSDEYLKRSKDKVKTPQGVKIGYTSNLPEDESPNNKVINNVAHTMETLQAKIEKQKQLLATVSENTEMNTVMTDSGKFVRLSDLDKPLPKVDLVNDKLMSSSTGSNRVYKLFANNYENKYFMSRSIGNHTNLITSEENSRSLSRLFPHLSKGFSSSLPNGVNVNMHFNRSPLELDDFTSDISVGSSLSSSMGKSGMDLSAEDSLSRQPRRLGEDLLRMFLEEISPDVSIDVSGRVLRAHKCILRSRCQYFAATLAGNEVETRGNVIVMDGYTYGAVHFALCHIYSGATRPPEGISLQELASLADLLGLEGLKEVTSHALKSTYCHMFHKPCDECIAGVCMVLPLAAGHGLDELHARCVRWLCRHFLRVWPTRPFATLSTDLMERARRHIIAHLSPENVLGTVLDCECLLSELPETRWATRVEALTLSLLEHAHMFVADKFPAILTANRCYGC